MTPSSVSKRHVLPPKMRQGSTVSLLSPLDFSAWVKGRIGLLRAAATTPPANAAFSLHFKCNIKKSKWTMLWAGPDWGPASSTCGCPESTLQSVNKQRGSFWEVPLVSGRNWLLSTGKNVAAWLNSYLQILFWKIMKSKWSLWDRRCPLKPQEAEPAPWEGYTGL